MQNEAAANPKISVHVIVYNQAHLVRETLDSIIAQNYDNMEIVVGDDASTDGTQDILREYAAKYPGKVIPVFAEVNRGITANGNAVFEKCTGDLIAIIGGDDLFLPNKLALQARAFDDPSVVLAYHPVEVFDSASNKTLFYLGQSDIESPASALEIISKYGLPASSVMFRHNTLPAGGYNQSLPTASDWLLSIEVALQGTIKKIPAVLARYRKHTNNIGNQISRYEHEFLKTLDIVRERYAHIPGINDACDHGRARYLAGYAFRVMVADHDAARRRRLWNRAGSIRQTCATSSRCNCFVSGFCCRWRRAPRRSFAA